MVPLFTICDCVTIYYNEIHKRIWENINGTVVFVLIAVGSLTRLINPATNWCVCLECGLCFGSFKTELWRFHWTEIFLWESCWTILIITVVHGLYIDLVQSGCNLIDIFITVRKQVLDFFCWGSSNCRFCIVAYISDDACYPFDCVVGNYKCWNNSIMF